MSEAQVSVDFLPFPIDTCIRVGVCLWHKENIMECLEIIWQIVVGFCIVSCTIDLRTIAKNSGVRR